MPYATSSGVRIHYEVEGSGIPLLLHVGFSNVVADCYQFGYVDALKADYRLVMLDPRGHGASDKPHDPAAHRPVQRVADVLAVLDALQLDQVHFLGYSMGGRIGFDLGVQAPHRFLSFAIGGAQPFALSSQWVQQYAQQATLLRQEGIAGFIASADRTTGPLPPERRQPLLAEDPDALAAVYEALAAAPDLAAELPAIGTPALVYCAEKDAAHAGAQRAAALMPDATFVSLPALTHTEGWRRSELVIPHLRALHARAGAVAAG